MAYDEKYRKRAVEFKDNGHTFKELQKVFGVSSRSYYDWKILKETTGFYAPKATKESSRERKIDPNKLKLAVEEKPDLYLRELAEIFNCSITAIHKRLEKLKITLKKRRLHTLKNQNQTGRNTSKK